MLVCANIRAIVTLNTDSALLALRSCGLHLAALVVVFVLDPCWWLVISPSGFCFLTYGIIGGCGVVSHETTSW